MPTHCPVCNQPAVAQIDEHTSVRIQLVELQRCKHYGRVYLHEGNHEPV